MFPKAEREAAITKMRTERWFQIEAAQFLVGLVKKEI
jgi:hypothetical protein